VAPQTNSIVSLKVTMAVLRGLASTLSTEISGMTSRLLVTNALVMATATNAAGRDLM
jgi:hypothetical protein